MSRSGELEIKVDRNRIGVDGRVGMENNLDEESSIPAESFPNCVSRRTDGKNGFPSVPAATDIQNITVMMYSEKMSH